MCVIINDIQKNVESSLLCQKLIFVITCIYLLQKLHIFLFNKVLVATRLVTQNGHQGYQVYRQPIPVEELVVEDLKDGEVKVGSFRSAFGSGQTGE